LSSLRAFEAVARLGSVTQAGAELGRTPGAVSKQLRTLQDHLGAALFEKAGTGLALNAHGRALARVVGLALDAMGSGYQAIAAELRAPSLHIACSVTFATRWLAPNLAAFSRAHPQLGVRLSMTSAGELQLAGADLLLTWDWRSYPASDQARAIRIAEVAFGPVCAPDYPIRQPSDRDYAAPVLITHDFTSRAWDIWQETSGLRLTADRRLSFPHTHLGIEAALSGMGVALVERRLIGRELAQGTLVAPFGFANFPDGLAAIVSEGTPAPHVTLFLAWIEQALNAGV